MQRLLEEIDRVESEVEGCLKAFDKPIAAADPSHRTEENQTQLRNLREHVIDLQKEMNAMTQESDSEWPKKTFDKVKRSGLETLAKLSKRLTQASQHLEQAAYTQVQSSAISTVSSADGNTKGVGALISNLSFANTQNPASPGDARDNTPLLSSSDDETSDGERSNNSVADRKQEPAKALPRAKHVETSSDESKDSEDEEETYIDDTGRLEPKAQNTHVIVDRPKKPDDRDQQARTSTPARVSEKPPPVELRSTPSSSPAFRRTSTSSTSASLPVRHQASRSHRPTEQTETSEDDSYSDEGEDDDDDDGVEASDPSAEQEDDPNVRQLRKGKYRPGTQFRALFNINAAQAGDLTARQGDILVLVEQTDDDWWVFKNSHTEQQGLAPINHIQLHSEKHPQPARYRQRKATSSLVDAFKTNRDIPSGFIASELASLAQHHQCKLTYTMTPKMSESNLTFADLHWRYDTEQIAVRSAAYQKILTIKKCSKIPKVNEQNIEVLNRCVRVCLYDGVQVVSNVHSSRLYKSSKRQADDATEDWHFFTNEKKAFIDEQSEFLIRSNESDHSEPLFLLIELCQLCQSKTNKERCEVGCGWIKIPLSDEHLHRADTSGTTKYHKRLRGGQLYDATTLLDSRYENLHSSGVLRRIDRRKQARIRFTLESREKHNDVLYNQLPLTPMIVPINLVRMLVFYRHELAYQLQKQSHASGPSTRPIQSIFLSTFQQALEQPELIYVLQLLYRRDKKLTSREQREEFIKTYELSIYPLLFYRTLPPYDFHDSNITNERRKLIITMTNKQMKKKGDQPDILALLLDPDLTDKWAPFTTDEIGFSLQKYVDQFRT